MSGTAATAGRGARVPGQVGGTVLTLQLQLSPAALVNWLQASLVGGQPRRGRSARS